MNSTPFGEKPTVARGDQHGAMERPSKFSRKWALLRALWSWLLDVRISYCKFWRYVSVDSEGEPIPAGDRVVETSSRWGLRSWGGIPREIRI